jgi:drug/metabolite transporter (DMT)-like permease
MQPFFIRYQGHAGAAGIVAHWIGFILVGRFGVTRELTAPDVIALRYGTAAAILTPLWLRMGRPNLFGGRLLVLAAIGGVGYAGTAYAGFALAPTAHAGLLLPGLLPLVTTALAWVALAERPARAQWVANAGIAAELVLFLWATPVSSSRGGDLLLIAAAVFWSLYGVLMRRWQVRPLETATAVAVFTALAYLPVYWLWLPKRIATASAGEILSQVFYQGLLTSVVQMLLYVRTVRLIGPARLAMAMALIAPAVAVAAWPLLDEPVGPVAGVAVGLIAISAWWGGYATRSSTVIPPFSPPCPT